MTFQPCGVIPAMVTPLTDSESLDETALRRLVNYLIAGGVHGVFAIGSQGEAYALTAEEKKRILEIVVDETKGRVPVYAGTGAVTTRETIALTVMAEQVGATAVSVITPYFITPSPDELYQHYVAVAQATRLPVLLYTNPARTGVALSPALAAKLARVDNIVGIKDSSGDLTLTTEYIRQTPSDFAVLAGRDTLIFATLMSGGAGAIAATANVAPALVAEIYNAQRAGNFDAARDAQNRLAPLRLAFEMGTFPVVIKEALALMGICSARAKSPVGPMADAKRGDLAKILQQLNVLPGMSRGEKG
jgi:4-hydroxy-tetrahydrodipicolinate synthase